MTKNQRITLSTTDIPIRLGMSGDPRPWLGVAHSLPKWQNIDDGSATPEERERLRELDASSPQFVWVRGVRLFDTATGIIFEVVPGDGFAPRHYSETATRDALPDEAPPLSRIWLNLRARQFLETQHGNATEFSGDRPSFEDPLAANDERRPGPRPQDPELIERVRTAYDAGESPRQMLAREFGITPNGADDWIKIARKAAEAAGNPLPTPTRGRGHKRVTPSTEGTKQ